MYLFIYADRTCKQVTDNLSVGDLLAVRRGLLGVYRVREGRFEKLVPDERTITWVPVPESRVAFSEESRFHL